MTWKLQDSYTAGLCSGVLAIVTFCVLYPIAAYQDPDYRFLDNYLSDLGVGSGAWAFNSALIVTGSLLAVFAIFGVYRAIGIGIWSKLGTAALAISGAFLVCIGIFTEDFDEVHTFFSFAFFITLLITLGLLSVAMIRTKALGSIGTGASITAFVAGATLIPLGANPFTETIAVLIILAWGSSITVLIFLKDQVQGSGEPYLRR
ncbi:MAG: DUF998 domain-containing protein [Thermoplasmata archaeon]|nr:DUF998 domain-containing protein [Thermoplasmata archaeon]MCJ7561763.1 DUF998 domain-containing protein [Thermoplasmata archaeon]TFG69038.1 MAG: DUF998 domain-containing protein [Methanomassiliicoccus sp.]